MRFFVAAVLAIGAMVVPATSASAQPNNQSGGAAGVIAANVQVQDVIDDINVLNNVNNIEIITVKDSLNNVLNNNDVLSGNTVTIQNFLNNNDCSVVAVCDSLTNFLNNNNVQISDVVAIDVLSGGDITIFVAPPQP